MFCQVVVNFIVKFCNMWVLWICVSEVVSILDFGKDMGWDRFIAFVDVATWSEKFVSLND